MPYIPPDFLDNTAGRTLADALVRLITEWEQTELDAATGFFEPHVWHHLEEAFPRLCSSGGRSGCARSRWASTAASAGRYRGSFSPFAPASATFGGSTRRTGARRSPTSGRYSAEPSNEFDVWDGKRVQTGSDNAFERVSGIRPRIHSGPGCVRFTVHLIIQGGGDLFRVDATQAGRRHPGDAGGKLVVAIGQRPQDGQRIRG